jgi:pimeloyl-ACP methyl ester carboxylesterase
MTLSKGKCFAKLPTGITMAYVETGPASGPNVILIHGLTDSLRSWSLTMAELHRLDPNLHILAVDQRGHGSSSMPEKQLCAATPEKCFRPADFANDIVAFMNAKKIFRATLVGHSLGSFVTQEVALNHPDMIERAVLVATSTKGTDNVVIRDNVLKELVEGRWANALEAKGYSYPEEVYGMTPLDADTDADTWIAKNWDADPVVSPSFIRPNSSETAHVRLGTWIGATKALLKTDNSERLKKLAVPTLVLWGSQDGIFLSDPDQTAMKNVLREAGLKAHTTNYWKQYGIAPLRARGSQENDIGHNVQWDAPEAVARDIEAFITTAAPIKELTYSEGSPNAHAIVSRQGNAIIERLLQ